jgi:putative CocE/NonD family hydrolase
MNCLISRPAAVSSPLRAAIAAWLLASAAVPAAAATTTRVTPLRQDAATAPQAIRKEAGVMVPMRDGVRLSTDVYFPADAEGPYSTILMRTPYGKDREAPYRGSIPLFVEAGYAVAFQDTRGRGVSEGEYTVRFSDREDGYDAVSWLVDQTWSNDQVATFGCSYLGETQITLAAERHPNHIAAIPMAAAAAYDPGGRPWTSFDGGVFELAQTAGWFMSVRAADRLELYSSLPVVDIVRKSGVVGSDYENFASNTPAADYFQALDFIRPNDRFDVPALYVDSWYDFGVAETLKLFNQQRENAISERARNNQYVIIAPSTHCGWTRGSNNQRSGARDVGDWQMDFDALYLRWYRFWLDGLDAGISDMPHVQYYLMGANEWRTADAWPVPGTSFEAFYLHSGGAANSLAGDGSLTTVPPGLERADDFTYDPTDPVPTRGGQACCTGMSTGAGGYDQSDIETRQDVLIYTSDVLTEGLEVTGPLEAVLYVSSDAPDTDFTVKLVDVYPDGIAYNVQEGALRMRYREGLSTKVLMEDGEVYEIRLDLHATSNYFGPGHRVRIEVSSSNFPRWSRNLNTGGNNFDETEWVVARNSVHHSAEYPSRILLPVVRR